MSSPSKEKGTKAETRVVKYLAQFGIIAKRKALSGSMDQGDIEVEESRWFSSNLIIEVKSGKQTINPTRKQIEEWMRQTRVEAINANSDGILVIARHGKNPADYDVWCKMEEDNSFMCHWYLDEWCKAYS